MFHLLALISGGSRWREMHYPVETMHTDELIQQVADGADEVERQGQIPARLAAELARANCFSLLLPGRLGGRQLDYPDYLRIVQSLARADGSTGWCVNQASVLSTLANQMPEAMARRIWPEPSRSIANGPPDGCELTAGAEGYRLTGRWGFSSGIAHADYLAGVAPLKQDGGTRKVLWCFFPKSAAAIDKSWNVNGLKGTASYGFSVDDLGIPADMVMEYRLSAGNPPLYRIPMNLLFACGFAAVALGVSRGALDFAIERARKKTKRFDRKTLSANESVQTQTGRAEALWRAAEMFLHGTVGSVWNDLVGGAGLDDAHRIALRMAGTHVIRQSMDVTDIAYALCSTDSIFRENEIQRRFQDMHVITQHLQGRSEIYALLGRYYLGEEFDSHLLS